MGQVTSSSGKIRDVRPWNVLMKSYEQVIRVVAALCKQLRAHSQSAELVAVVT